MAIRYEQDDRVVTITLNRPEAMNAIDPETHQELIDAWLRFRDDPDAWVAILTGAGQRAFCAGADLKKLIPLVFDLRRAAAEPQRLRPGGDHPGDRIWKPVIAAVNGYALAGGLELVLASDLRVAAEHATFGLTETRWAIMPGAGGTQRLPRAVPMAKAMEMILLAEPIDAPEAHRLGLINAVVPAAEVLPTAQRWARTITERGPLAIRAAKEAIVRGQSCPWRRACGWRRSCPGRCAGPRTPWKVHGLRREAQAPLPGAVRRPVAGRGVIGTARRGRDPGLLALPALKRRVEAALAGRLRRSGRPRGASPRRSWSCFWSGTGWPISSSRRRPRRCHTMPGSSPFRAGWSPRLTPPGWTRRSGRLTRRSACGPEAVQVLGLLD